MPGISLFSLDVHPIVRNVSLKHTIITERIRKQNSQVLGKTGIEEKIVKEPTAQITLATTTDMKRCMHI
ncbi:hypothetical protein [Sporosarcina sp. G11-34]|uniref:hypothetical protein n=1 Tax=Sporosarcina sp. G11-34 TaxID=2849605 RepID=UPI0022A94F1A|nr:hypothetical protein [Sporosarcina sp. G11-34]